MYIVRPRLIPEKQQIFASMHQAEKYAKTLAEQHGVTSDIYLTTETMVTTIGPRPTK